MNCATQAARALGTGRRRGPIALLFASATVALAANGCISPRPRDADTSDQEFVNDSAFAAQGPAAASQDTPDPPRVNYELAVVHVLVPHSAGKATQQIWQYLREDALDAQVQLRLRKNGVRVGVGAVRWWDSIKTALESIEGCEVNFASPIRMPIGFVLSLELDTAPREQTLFFLNRDGYLTGSTIPASRNVLRLSYAPDPHDYRGVQLLAVPEVYRRREGWEWVRQESGLAEGGALQKTDYDAVGFVVTLKPGEFALVAPSENADIYGLLGGVFLTRETEGKLYDSYIFLRPEAK